MHIFRSIRTALRMAVQDRRGFRQHCLRSCRKLRLRFSHERPFVTSIQGFPFVCHPRWTDSVDLYLGKNWDELELRVLQKWLFPGDVFIDVGANMGVYSACAASIVRNQGHVLSIEASRQVATLLKEKWMLLRHDPSSILQVAISDKVGTTSFFESEPGDYTGTQSLDRRVALGSTKEISVPTTTLIELEKKLPRKPAALKIDIEGAERMALRAVPTEWLGATGPLWIIEINPGALARFGATVDEVVSHFPAASFEKWILPKHPIPPASSTAPRCWNPEEKWSDSIYYNLIAIPLHVSLSKRRSVVASELPTRDLGPFATQPVALGDLTSRSTS
jgi:FkbM family methyltransferase